MMCPVGNRVKMITHQCEMWNEHGDIEIKDYVDLPRGQDNCLKDFTMTDDQDQNQSLHLIVNTPGPLYDDFLLLIFFHTVYTLIERLVLWSDNYRKNLIRFDFFVLNPYLILRDLLVWSCLTSFVLVPPPPLLAPSLVLLPPRSAY